MPVVPVLPGYAGLDGWSLWQKGRICAANVTWSADATDPNAQQNFLLSHIAHNKGYNAIRLVLSAGSSESAWDDMYQIAVNGWNSSTTLANGGQPISEIRDNIINILDKCEKLGLGVILDCHDFFQRNTATGVGPLWVGASTSSGASAGKTASQLRDALVLFWTQTVQAFPASTYKAIIGYEILNEPNPDQNLTFTQMESGNDNCWSKLATRCIKAIRAQGDLNTPIVVDGIYYADAYGLKYFDPTLGGAGLLNDYLASGAPKAAKADYRLVYSFHAYSPFEFTHQGVSDATYESQGLPYPLNSVQPFGTSGAFGLAPRLRVTLNDGSASAVAANSGSTSKTVYLPFNNYANLLARYQPAVDFQTHAAASQSGVAVPIFVGEFSAVDTTLIQSGRIPTSITRRTITRIQVDGSGWATVTLAGNLNIALYPQYDASDMVSAYSDFARATITGCANSAYNITDFRQVRLEHGNNQISHRTWGAGNLGFQYDVGTGPGVSDYSPPGGAVLTIKSGLNASSNADASRANYIKDVLTMCLSHGFSWGYWQEDGYTATTSNIDTLNAGVFVAWRPSSLVSTVLNRAASRRSVS